MTVARRVVAGEQVDALLEAVASGATEPGSGSGAFAALSAATGAALVTAVARHTLKRLASDDPDGARLMEIADEADAARPALLAWADRDAEIHRRLTLAARLPQETDEERTERLVSLQSVLENAVDVQLDLARRAVLLAGLAEEVSAAADPNAAADGLGAVAALHAAAVAALANVELNAFAIVDPERRDELTATCDALGARASNMLDDAHAAFGSRVRPAPS
jgi:methenyltetrahydrofolate cyclohydrolase